MTTYRSIEVVLDNGTTVTYVRASGISKDRRFLSYDDAGGRQTFNMDHVIKYRIGSPQ